MLAFHLGQVLWFADCLRAAAERPAIFRAANMAHIKSFNCQRGADTRAALQSPSCRNVWITTHLQRSSGASALCCRAASTTQYEYQAPSSITAATELSALSALSSVVPDTYLSRSLHVLTSPKAATVSSSVLYGILQSPGSQREAEVRMLGFISLCNSS